MISIFYDVGVVSVTVVCRSFTVPSVVCLMQMEFFFFYPFFLLSVLFSSLKRNHEIFTDTFLGREKFVLFCFVLFCV